MPEPPCSRKHQHAPPNYRLFHNRFLARDKVIVTYCDGVFCNASTKAAAKLTALGFRVKEMLDGMEG